MTEWQTKDIFLASCLDALDFRPLRVDYDETNIGYFIFKDTVKLQNNVEKFWNGELKFEPQHLFQSFRRMKQRLYPR